MARIRPVFESIVMPVPEMQDMVALQIRGRINYQNAADLRKRILKEIAHPPARRLVIDLEGVVEMDTAGAAVLVEALKKARDQDLKMLLCAPSQSVLSIFRLAGLSEVLDCCCSGPEDMQRKLANPVA
ncbi:MAG: STAS domain-containing protein [Acidobacteriota bacterium]